MLKELREEPSKFSKLKESQIGGKEIIIVSFKKPKKEVDGKETIQYFNTPEVRLESYSNPEVKDLKIGDKVKLEMVVTGLKWDVTDEGDKVCATLTLQEEGKEITKEDEGTTDSE